MSSYGTRSQISPTVIGQSEDMLDIKSELITLCSHYVNAEKMV